MKKHKRIALVAHDNRKSDLIEWVEWNWKVLSDHQIICTGTTGKLVEEALTKRAETGGQLKHKIKKLKSGPLGGDQQLGALITEGNIDMMIFFWDPMQPQPHDVDVKALLRITVLYNVPTACNRSTADFLISSVLFNETYTPIIKDYSEYINRNIGVGVIEKT
jgi:methylglyoxal synthase